MMRKSSAAGVLLAGALALLLAGCALPALPWQRATGPRPLPDSQQVAHVVMRPPPARPAHALDPMREVETAPWGAQIISLLYSGLFTLDAHLRPTPTLAATFSVSPDGLTYTFHLRAGLRFTDGTPLTSADVAFSLNRLMTDCGSSAAWAFASVKDAQALASTCPNASTPGASPVTTLVGDSLLTPDPTTLTVLLSRPDGALLAKLAEPYSAIVERAVVARYGDQWTLHLTDRGGQGTSGMYALTALTAWLSGVDGALTLTAARGYWGPRPRLRRVMIALRWPSSPTPTQPAYTPVAPADTIILDGLGRALPTTAQRAGLVYQATPDRMTTYLALNASEPPLDDARARQSLELALDKTALAGLVNGLPTNYLIPPGTGDYPSALSGAIAAAPLTGDVTQARALWASYVHDACGGDASRCHPIPLYAIGGTAALQMAVVARWRAVLPGIRTFAAEPPDILMPGPILLAANVLGGVEDYPDPQDWLLELVSAPSGASESAVHDPQADALAARAAASLDPSERLALYQQAESSLLDGGYIIPIAQARDVWAIRPDVANFPANPAPWIPPDAWARIELTTTPGGK